MAAQTKTCSRGHAFTKTVGTSVCPVCWPGHYKKANVRGFSLVELLVVVSIIGMLSSIVYASIKPDQEKAHDAQRSQDLRTLQTALERYYSDNGKYPIRNPAVSQASYFESRPSADPGGWALFATFLTPKYLSTLPVDPMNDRSEGTMHPTANAAEYTYNGTANQYILSTYLAGPHSWQTGSNIYGTYYSIVGGTCTVATSFWTCN